MPELPDVEGFRRVLRKAAGRPIERVDVVDAGVLRGVGAGELRDALTGATFAAPRRHGKWLIGPVRRGRRHRRDEPSVVFHFGMTGSLTWTGRDVERHRHDRVVVGTGSRELRYRDLRKLQGIRLLPDADRRRLHRELTTVLRQSTRAGRVTGWPSWLTGHRDERDGACPRCGTTLRRTRLGGRTTAWCPNCQPE